MSLSKEERQTDMARALQMMLQCLGDRRISMCFFDSTEPPFDAVPQTTWIELQDRGHIKPVFNLKHYGLTGNGWLHALHASGKTEDPDFERDSGKLLRSLKKRIKGRQSAALVTVEAIARDSGLAEDWIFNAIESNVIEAQFNRTGAVWAHGFEGMMILVPIMFGMKI